MPAMLATRRELLRSLSTTSAVSALAGSLYAASPRDRSVEQENAADQTTYDFWSQNVRDPNFTRMRSVDASSAPRAVFVYFDKSDGFVTGSDISDAGLPERGDLNVIVNVDHIHLSANDQTRFSRLEGGSLRIDLQQTTPLPSLAERLGWTSIAALLPDNKRVPAAKDMNFNPGTTWGKLQSVPLPGGGGHWTWNFFLQQRKARWMQLFEAMRREKSLLLPIFGLGLPAIAITALQTVDNIVAEMTRDANTDWLFQSPDVYVYATQKARDAFEGSKLRLRQGMYVIVPSTQLAEFAKQSTGLEVKDGLIVPKNTRSLEVLSKSQEVLTNVTYLTVGVTARMVQPSRA